MTPHFQQTAFWADFKCAHGWKSIEEQGVRVLTRTFHAAFLKATLAYVPMAPLPSEEDGTPKAAKDIAYIKQIADFTASLRHRLPKNTLCVRYDFPLDFAAVEERDGYVSGVKDLAVITDSCIEKADVDVQPPDTVVLDLSPETDELLSAMKSKWRYNIRYAAKHGVTVRAVHGGEKDFDSGGYGGRFFPHGR